MLLKWRYVRHTVNPIKTNLYAWVFDEKIRWSIGFRYTILLLIKSMRMSQIFHSFYSNNMVKIILLSWSDYLKVYSFHFFLSLSPFPSHCENIEANCTASNKVQIQWKSSFSYYRFRSIHHLSSVTIRFVPM